MGRKRASVAGAGPGVAGYFDDLAFVAGDIAERCEGVVAGGRFPHFALQLVLASPRHAMRFARDDGELRTLRAPHWCWHHPRHRYRYHPARAGGHWHHCWVAFSGERGRRLIEGGFEPLARTGLLPVQRPGPARAAFARLVECLARADGHAAAVVELEGLLALAIADAAAPAASPIDEVVARIDDDPARPLDLVAEARRLGWSAPHLRRRFRERTGRPPLAYALHRRVQRAAALLREGDEPVATIARTCGFSDAHAFARHFRRQLGMSLSAFRGGAATSSTQRA